MIRLQHIRAALVTIPTLALALSALGASAAPEPIRIGAILSFSGPSAPLGQPQVNALKLAETTVNAHGGIDGRPIHFEIVDDDAKADVASQLATQQIASGVAAIICGTRVDTTNAVARITAQAGVLQIILTPTISTWRSDKGVVSKTIFQAQASDELEAKAVLDYGKRKLGVKKIGIIHDANFFGTSGADIATGIAKTDGIEVLGNEAYAGDATDFTPQVQKLMSVSPDAILMWGATTTPALVTKAIRTLGYTKPMLSSGGVDSDAFLKISGPASAGVCRRQPLEAEPQRRTKIVRDALRKNVQHPGRAVRRASVGRHDHPGCSDQGNGRQDRRQNLGRVAREGRTDSSHPGDLQVLAERSQRHDHPIRPHYRPEGRRLDGRSQVT